MSSRTVRMPAVIFDHDAFLFVDDPAVLFDGNTLLCRVPKQMTREPVLMQWFYENLSFPHYFGRNWNALNDCLMCLEGIDELKVILFHEDVPLLDSVHDCAIYLAILNEVSKDWRRSPEHEFVVAFSPSCRPKIVELHVQFEL